MPDPKVVLEQTKARIIRYGKDGIISKKNMELMLEFNSELSARGYSENRQIKYLNCLSVFCNKNRNFNNQSYKDDFGKISKKETKELVAWIRGEFNGETPRDYMVILRIFVRWIIWVRSEKKERFRKNEFPEIVDWIEPENQIKKRKLPKNLLNIEDINKLAEATKNNRNRAIVLFLYETGCRIGELLELKIEDVEFDKYGARITIPIEGKTGNRKIRVVSCSPALLIWLKEHPTKKDTTSPLFCGIWSKKIGLKLNYDYVRLMLKDLFKETGINKPSNPHHFRHSRASELANTLTESQLCHYMGWVQGSKEARTYVHLSGRDLDKDVLQMYGIDITEEDKKTEFKPKTCPRCGVINDPASTYCTGCNLGLSDQAIKDYMEEKQTQTQKMERQSRKMEILTRIQQINTQVARGKLTWADVDKEMDQLEKELEKLNDG